MTPLVPQGEWLSGSASGSAPPRWQPPIRSAREELADAVQRLTGADQMGELFKVIAIHSPDWPVPPGFE